VRSYLLAFIPLLVAVDAVGLVASYLGLGIALPEPERRRLVLEATRTGAGIGLAFVLVGDAVLYFLGVTVGDFQIAGGLLLLILSMAGRAVVRAARPGWTRAWPATAPRPRAATRSGPAAPPRAPGARARRAPA
jgi:small neutral amino acid transporter SnatA (MarC family)